MINKQSLEQYLTNVANRNPVILILETDLTLHIRPDERPRYHQVGDFTLTELEFRLQQTTRTEPEKIAEACGNLISLLLQLENIMVKELKFTIVPDERPQFFLRYICKKQGTL